MGSRLIGTSRDSRYIASTRLLEEAEGRAHGGLDVQALDVLPVLLQEGHEEVDTHLGVDEELALGHLHVPDRHGEAQHLLELELDLRADAVHLVFKGLVVRAQGGKLPGFVQAGAEETGNLLNHGLRGEEVIVLLSELLDELFVLVQLLKRLHVHVVNADALRFFAVLRVTEHAQLELGPGDGGQGNRAVETLVLLRVVLLQPDLKLDRFRELTRLGFAAFQNIGDGLAEGVGGELAVCLKRVWGVRRVGCGSVVGAVCVEHAGPGAEDNHAVRAWWASRRRVVMHSLQKTLVAILSA
jgi:hypothetical protein